MSFKQYGKPSAALLQQKRDFFENNEKYLNRQHDIAAIYASQPRRQSCKNCNLPFNPAEPDFEKDRIGYIICSRCGHLSGIYQDTTAFCNALYVDDSGKSYGSMYEAKDLEAYNYRTASIYSPKAEFLYTSLLATGIEPNQFKYLDFGSGTGYFVSALQKLGLLNIVGSEVSKSQVELGNAMMGSNLLQVHKMDATSELLGSTDANVVSMIGVLEHLQEPRKAMEVLSVNNAVQYLYLSVPVFSLSVFLEKMTTDIFHRHLSSAHTHLYTASSLAYMANEFNFEIVSEWWFGADMVDLFRQIKVTLAKSGASQKVDSLFSEKMLPAIDAMQMELDKKEFSSEVHMLLRKKKTA